MQSKRSYFLRNLATGLVWLAIIVALFVFAKHNVNQELVQKFEPIFDNTFLIIFIYILSELMIGILPPELFMIWALRDGNAAVYISYIVLFFALGYLAGLAGYLFGRYLNTTRLYRYIRYRFLRKTEKHLNDFGLYLILVAAITPVPLTGTAMLVGAVKYPAKKYILWSISLCIKFIMSGIVIWEANML